MPSHVSQEDVEVFTIDDDTVEMRRKRRTLRKSTGVGGKAPHLAITFKPVRRTLPMEGKKKKAIPEYFDIADDDDEDVEDSDDIQVIEQDPLDEQEGGEGFCEVCGLGVEGRSEMGAHLLAQHGLVSCRWCNVRMREGEVKGHIGEGACDTFSKLLGRSSISYWQRNSGSFCHNPPSTICLAPKLWEYCILTPGQP